MLVGFLKANDNEAISQTMSSWSFNLDFPLFLQILKASKRLPLLPQEDQPNHTLQKMAVIDRSLFFRSLLQNSNGRASCVIKARCKCSGYSLMSLTTLLIKVCVCVCARARAHVVQRERRGRGKLANTTLF